MTDQKSRRRWTAEEKLGIIEEARQTPQTVSGVCRRHGIATGQFPGLTPGQATTGRRKHAKVLWRPCVPRSRDESKPAVRPS
jgi:hypothetical protein